MPFPSKTDSFLKKHEYRINRELMLRPLMLSDATASFNLICKNRDRLKEYLPWVDFVKRLDDEVEYIKEAMSHIKAGTKLEMAIFLKNSDNEAKEGWNMIGMCGFVSIKDGCGNIGYWLDEDHTGKGIMTSACTCLMEKTAKKILLSRVVGHVSPRNIKSMNTLKRLGFTTDKVISRTDLYGRMEDLLLYVCPNYNLK